MKRSMWRLCAVPLAVIVGLVAADAGRSSLSVGTQIIGSPVTDIITGATSTGGGGSGGGTGGGTGGVTGGGVSAGRVLTPSIVDYYYVLCLPDGSKSIEVMNEKKASDRKNELLNEYKTLNGSLMELKKSWQKVFGQTPFPVSLFQKPELIKGGKVPAASNERARADENLHGQLERYFVCLVTDSGGQSKFEVVRQDRVFKRRQDLEKNFAEASIKLKAVQDANPKAQADAQTLKMPTIQQGSKAVPKDKAEEMALKLNEKLAEQQAKAKAAAEAEKAGQAGNSNGAGGASGAGGTDGNQ